MKIIKTKNIWYEVSKDFTGIVEYTSGDKRWYLNGKRHREDGPAVEFGNGDKSWYLNGRAHRIDGPAIEWINGYKEYWINGKNVTKEAQEVLYGLYKLKGIM